MPAPGKDSGTLVRHSQGKGEGLLIMHALTIYAGQSRPLKARGKNQCRLLDFAFRFPGWHSYKPDRSTLQALAGLERKGILEVSRETLQFRLTTNHK